MRWPIVCLLLSHFVALPCPAASAAEQVKREAILDRRDRLEAKFQELTDGGLNFLRRNRHQSLLFLANQRFDAGDDPEHARLAKLLGGKLFSLAKAALEADQPTLAYELLHEAMYFGNSTAEKIVGSETNEPKVILATSKHSKLLWNRREYFHVTTDHFQVTTQSKEDGVELAKRLETLHSVWGQIFFECWCGKARLSTSIERQRPLVPTAKKSRRHRVVLFPNRDEYVDFLRRKQPRIGITLGFYDLGSRTSYFFSGPKPSASTQLHEVTHQLFQEAQRTSPRLTFDKNFWVIEGVAMYMESLQVVGPVATVGGWHANRLQFARYRALQENFYVPADELVALGRIQLQQDARIRKIYSQSAGLSHFLMDANKSRYRNGVIEYLKKIYAGRDHTSSLAEGTGLAGKSLDQAYRQYLLVDDAAVRDAWLVPDSLESLCLGDTRITDAAFEKMTSQRNLDWLDLARTRVTDKGTKFLEQTRSLRQLSLDGCSISDTTIKRLKQNTDLEELDLANTLITDDSAEYLASMNRLKILWLTNTNVTDVTVEQLHRLESLEFLSLGKAGVSEGAREELRKKLPNLTIE